MSAVLIIAVWLFAIASVVGVVKRWNAPRTHASYSRPTWWAWGEVSWMGYRRSVLLAALIVVCFAVALTVPTTIGVYFGLAAFFLLFPLALAIALFNRPKLLVPPACRGDRGPIH